MTEIVGADAATVHHAVEYLQREIHSCAVEHGWWEDGVDARNMGEAIALMHSELSEALESYRNGEPDLWYKHDPARGGHKQEPFDREGNLGKPEGIASEFADTIIRILDICEAKGIPVVEAMIRKHNYNETRSYRHGGKKA